MSRKFVKLTTGGGGEDLPTYESLPVVMPSGVRYYYNRKDLPEIPKYVLEDYPYVCIMAGDSYCDIVATNEKGYFHTIEDGTKRTTFPGARLYLRSGDTSEDWWTRNGYPAGSTYFAQASVWWSNYDVPKGSPEGTEIHFPASLPTTELPADATRFYYNGVVFPKIPSEFDELPYLFIKKNLGADNYQLLGCAEKAFYNPDRLDDQPNVIDQAVGAITYCNINLGDAAWGKTKSGNFYTTFDFIVWANYNIPNGSSAASDIYFYGTPAVPDPAE